MEQSTDDMDQDELMTEGATQDDSQRSRSESTAASSAGEDAADDTIRTAFPEFVGLFAQTRAAKGLSLKSLAKATGLARPTLTRLAAGDTNPRITSVKKLANALGVSLYSLLGPESSTERSERTETKPDAAAGAFLSRPARADQRAMELYERLVRGESTEKIYESIHEQRLFLPGEDPESTLVRLTLDLIHARRVSIDSYTLQRNSDLERRLTGKLDLRSRNELRDTTPVRVIDLPDHFPRILRTLAIGAMGAEVLRELLGSYRTLGFSDGFTTAALQLFLGRGDLYRVEAVPLVFTPAHVQYELSGASLVGSLLRTHLGYDIKSTVELSNLQSKIEHVQVAVLSCGAAVRDEDARIPRILRETNPERDYASFERQLQKRGVVGDLMYHFLDRNGHKARIGASRDLSEVHKYRVRHLKPGDPVIFSASLETLYNIARRGVSMLLVPSPDRAAVCRAAALRQKAPINFVVTDGRTAKAILEQ